MRLQALAAFGKVELWVAWLDPAAAQFLQNKVIITENFNDCWQRVLLVQISLHSVHRLRIQWMRQRGI
jgi:hypothetical protein